MLELLGPLTSFVNFWMLFSVLSVILVREYSTFRRLLSARTAALFGIRGVVNSFVEGFAVVEPPRYKKEKHDALVTEMRQFEEQLTTIPLEVSDSDGFRMYYLGTKNIITTSEAMNIFMAFNKVLAKFIAYVDYREHECESEWVSKDRLKDEDDYHNWISKYRENYMEWLESIKVTKNFADSSADSEHLSVEDSDDDEENNNPFAKDELEDGKGEETN